MNNLKIFYYIFWCACWTMHLGMTHAHLEHALRIVWERADFLVVAEERMERVPLLLHSKKCIEGAPQYMCKGDGTLQYLQREEVLPYLHRKEGAEVHDERTPKDNAEVGAQCVLEQEHRDRHSVDTPK